MYTIPAALAQIDHDTAWVLIISGWAWVTGAIQFLEGLRLTWRDKVVGLPLGYICIVFAHDSYYLLHYDFWLHGVNHWYFDATTFLFLIWPFLEIISIVWLVRVAHAELAPDLSRLTWYGIYAVFQVTAIALYLLLQSWLDDPLLLTGWSIASIVNITFMIPMALRRKSTRGQSRLMVWSVLLGPASLNLLMPISIVPALLTPYYWFGSLSTAALGVAYLLVYEHYRRLERQTH